MATELALASALETGTTESVDSKRVLWQQRITAWQASGLSQKAWCEREQIPLSSLGYWRKRLRNDESGSDESASPRFIPVSLTESASPVTIRMGGSMTIEISAGIDRGLLRDLLSVLRTEA